MRARRDQPGDRVTRLAYQHVRRRLVHQPRARRQGIAQMQFGVVVGANGGGQPTLGIAGIALAERRFGNQDDAQAGGQIERDGQPGDAAADDSHVAIEGIYRVATSRWCGHTLTPYWTLAQAYPGLHRPHGRRQQCAIRHQYMLVSV